MQQSSFLKGLERPLRIELRTSGRKREIIPLNYERSDTLGKFAALPGLSTSGKQQPETNNQGLQLFWQMSLQTQVMKPKDKLIRSMSISVPLLYQAYLPFIKALLSVERTNAQTLTDLCVAWQFYVYFSSVITPD